jgi:GT2 family glycosyltransferase
MSYILLKKEIAILLPVHNHLHLTKDALKEVSNQTPKINSIKFHIILIDDGSNDNTAEWVHENYPDVIILKGDGNLWWSGAVNMGARYAIENLSADYIILYNNDIHIDDNYFPALLKILSENDTTTLIGSKIYVAEQPNLIWSMGGYFNPKSGKYGMYGYYEGDSAKYNNLIAVDWLTGMGTIIPRKVVEKIGYWDNVNFPQYHGDSDFTYRAKISGFKIIVDPTLKIYNFVKNSGIENEGSIKKIFNLITDIRSKSNLKKNLLFYKKHSKSLRAYFPLLWIYLKLFGGFFKWQILNFVGITNKHLLYKSE